MVGYPTPLPKTTTMKQHHFTTSTDEAQQIHYIIWQPDEQPRAVLQIVHGMEEYIDRYDAFARHMVAHGWAVIGHDHLGHGESGIHERGHFSDHPIGPHLLIDDIYRITQVAQQRWPNSPICIMGHSMGSFLTRRYLCEHSQDIHAAIIMGSGWYSAAETGLAYYAAKLTSAIRGRHTKSKPLTALCSLPFLFSFRNEGKNAWLSVNKQNVDGFTTDPLRGFGFTAGGYEYMYKNLLEVSRHKLFEQIRRDLPILFIAGEDDPVGGAKAVKRLEKDFRKHGFSHITPHIVKGKRHELFFEDNAVETMLTLSAWLNAQLPASARETSIGPK